MLDKNLLKCCLSFLIVSLIFVGTHASSTSLLNSNKTTNSNERALNFENQTIDEYFQAENDDTGFAEGINFRNYFYDTIYCLYQQDNLTYVGTNEGVMIYNCENKSDIQFVNNIFPNRRIMLFDMIAPNISIIEEYGNLFIYNISNPDLPTLIFDFEYYYINWFEIKNEYLYFYRSSWGFYVFDISTPTNPIEIHFEPIDLHSYYNVVIDNNNLILLDQYTCEIYFYNISNVENIQLETVYLDKTSSYYDWDKVIVKGNLLLIENDNEVTIYSFEDLPNVEILVTINIEDYNVITFEKSYLYMEDRGAGVSYIKIYNLTNPSLPIMIGESESLYYHRFYGVVEFSDNFLFLASNDVNLFVVNLTIPSNFDIVSIVIGGSASTFAFYQNLMFVGSSSQNTLRIYNFSNPFKFRPKKSMLTNHTMQKIIIVNNYLVGASSNSPSLYIYDISNPLNPNLVFIYRVYSGYDTIRNFEIENNKIFVLFYNDLYILNFENILNIEEIFHLTSDNYLSSLLVNNIALGIYSEYTNTLLLYDHSNAENIQFLSEINCGGIYNSDSLAISDNLLTICFQYHTLKIYDISNPANPILKSELVNAKSMRDFSILKNYLFAIEEHNTVKVYKITDDFIPIPYWTHLFEDYISNVEFIDEEIIYYDGYNGINSFGFDTDSDLLLDTYEEKNFYTNKFNPDTDADNLSDFFETYYGLNPLNPSDRDLDIDMDNLTNFEESLQFSDPFKLDTESDGLTDFEEFNYHTNPVLFDSDSDFLSDYDEIKYYFTNPILNDTDYDELLDGIEILYSFTNPFNNDTDTDEMNDWWEYSYLLNPNDPSDKLLDLDLDGLSNFEEYLLGTYPHSSDSDNDGFTDYIEFQLGTDPMDSSNYPNRVLNEETSIHTPIIVVTFIGIYTIVYIQRKKRRRK